MIFRVAQSKTAYAMNVGRFVVLLNAGRSDRIRTYDPLIPNQMRYQAALRSGTHDCTAFAATRSNQRAGDQPERRHAGENREALLERRPGKTLCKAAAGEPAGQGASVIKPASTGNTCQRSAGVLGRASHSRPLSRAFQYTQGSTVFLSHQAEVRATVGSSGKVGSSLPP